MKGLCPACEDYREIRIKKQIEETTVKGKSIKAEAEISICNYCNNEFATAEQMDVTLKNAFSEYRIALFN